MPKVYTLERGEEDPLPDPFPFPKTYEITLEAELALGTLYGQ